MPIYSYLDDRDGKTYDLVQGMNEIHEAFAPDGYKLLRIFSVPNASIDNKIDPNNPQDFVKYTSNRKGTIGQLQDLSGELSQKRADKNGGIDPIAEANYKKYKETRKKDHPDVKKRKLKEKLKNNKFIELAN